MASAIACFLGQGDTLPSAVERARTFVRVALFAAPGLGQGAGPVGTANVRLDIGPGPRLNQVTLTVNDYAKSVHFYSLLGLKQIVDSPENLYARFETAGGATLSIQADPDEKVSATTAVYLECDDLDTQVERLARAGIPFEHAHACRHTRGGYRATRCSRPARQEVAGGRDSRGDQTVSRQQVE